MYHSVHRLVSNCVCLLFCAEQVVYSESFRAISLKTAVWCSKKNITIEHWQWIVAVRLWAGLLNNELKKTIVVCKAGWTCRFRINPCCFPFFTSLHMCLNRTPKVYAVHSVGLMVLQQYAVCPGVSLAVLLGIQYQIRIVSVLSIMPLWSIRTLNLVLISKSKCWYCDKRRDVSQRAT